MQPPAPGIGLTTALSASPRPRTGPLNRRLGTGLTAFFLMATMLGTVATASPARATATTLYAHGTATTAGSSAAAARQGTDPRVPAPRAGIADAPSFESPDSDFLSIFTPLPTLPAQVKAPSVKETAAFAALNALLGTETRFGEAVVAIRVSLDRASAAAGAGAQLWLVRQVNASAQYALAASRLLGRFPALQAAVVHAFVADKMTLTLSPAQFAAARVRLLPRPAGLVHPPARRGGGGVPAHDGPRGGRAEGLDPRHARYRAGLGAHGAEGLGAASSVRVELGDGTEARLAAALKGYADSILQPVPASALGGMARRLEPDAMLAAAEGPGRR